MVHNICYHYDMYICINLAPAKCKLVEVTSSLKVIVYVRYIKSAIFTFIIQRIVMLMEIDIFCWQVSSRYVWHLYSWIGS